MDAGDCECCHDVGVIPFRRNVALLLMRFLNGLAVLRGRRSFARAFATAIVAFTFQNRSQEKSHEVRGT